MKKTARTLLISTAAIVMLTGCAEMMAQNTPPASDTDQIQAQEQAKATEQTTRQLFLDVVHGLKSQGKHRAVLAYLDDYDGRFPGDLRSKILRAEALVALGEGERAVPLLRTLSDGPFKARAYAAMGKVWAQRGKWKQAVKAFGVAHAADPTDAGLLNNLGYAHLKTGAFDDAARMLQRALELDETNKAVRNNLILAYYLLGDKQTASRIIARLPDGEKQGVQALLKSFRVESR